MQTTAFLSAVIPLAFVLDMVLGDPRWLPHPVRWMGQAIEWCEPRIRRLLSVEILAGAVMSLGLIGASFLLTWMFLKIINAIYAPAAMICEIVLIFYCLSARSLAEAALEIDTLLKNDQVDGARSCVSMIVGRDVSAYGAEDIARATVETVAENFSDGVVAPLFFAALGGAPAAIAYKMVNTLDSMIGYKNERYLKFGKAAARIDDVLNYIPSRLAIAAVAAATFLLDRRRAKQVLATAIQEGSDHSSPNAGYPEAAFAGALGVRLNGPNIYHGVLVNKPYIGKAFGNVARRDIKRACDLMVLAAAISVVCVWVLTILL